MRCHRSKGIEVLPKVGGKTFSTPLMKDPDAKPSIITFGIDLVRKLKAAPAINPPKKELYMSCFSLVINSTHFDP